MSNRLITAIEEHAQEQAEKIAIRFLKSDEEAEEVSFKEIAHRVEVLSKKLSACIQPNRRVVLVYQPSVNFIIAILACMKAKLIAVPLPFPNAENSVERVEHVCKDCSPILILCGNDSFTRLEKNLSSNLKKLLLSDESTEDAFKISTQNYIELSNILLDNNSENQIVILQYTSGSTGNPKGVIILERNLIENLEQIKIAFEHNKDSIGVIWLPHYHDMGLIGGIFQPLYVGFEVNLFSTIRFIQKPVRWIEAIDKYRATTSGGPSFAYDICSERIDVKKNKVLDLSCWKGLSLN